MKKLKVCINKDCFTADYVRHMKLVLIKLAENYIQRGDDRNSKGEAIEVFEVEVTNDMAEAILAMSDYDMWYAEPIKKRKVYCPVNGIDCPYYRKSGLCTIENPIEECDDFGTFWDKDDEYWVEEEDD